MPWQVSVKGVVWQREEVLLARNRRGEWELPGGRLEVGETPAQCVEREVLEECGLIVSAGPLLHCEPFEVVPEAWVLIVSYGCSLVVPAAPVKSHEHAEIRFVAAGDLGRIALPDVYRAAIDHWPAGAR